MSVPELLRRAAAIIEERGWWRPNYGGGTQPYLGKDGRQCALTALHVAAGEGAVFRGDEFNEAIAALVVRLRRTRCGASITDWNDAVGRTAEDVTSTLRSVADSLSAGAPEAP